MERYLQVHTVVWDDEYFYWLYARIEELIEQNARESVGLVLPAIVEGIALLGSTTAKFPNPLNASLDEGTTLMTEALEHIISLTGTPRRSPAARMAARAIGDVGASCLEAEKFTVVQAPVEALLRIGVGTADKLPDVAREAVIGLSRLLLSLAESDSNDVMRGANAERIVEGLSAIIEREGRGRLGPSYVLVAPMSDISTARLCQTMARAKERHDHGYRQRNWDSLVSTVAQLCSVIWAHYAKEAIAGPATIETAATTALGLLVVESRDSIDSVIVELSHLLIGLALADEEHHPAPELIAPVCAATYVASDPPTTERPALRDISAMFAQEVGRATAEKRGRLTPILRQVGATALHFRDEEMAKVMAANTVPNPAAPATMGVEHGLFSFGLNGLPGLIGRPGVVLLEIPEFYREPDAQQRFLMLERQLRP